MTRVVYKYPVFLTDHQFISLPKTAKILRFGEQDGKLFIWALVDVEPASTTTGMRYFRLAGTGHDIHEHNLQHLGSVICHGGALVWHLFEIVEKDEQ